MPHYAYKFRDARGEVGSGTLEAASVAEAGQRLRGEGKFVVHLAESLGKAKPDANDPAALRKKRIKREHVITFAHQLAVMVDTGVSISEALACIAEQCDDAAFRAVLSDVAETVESGGELSNALTKYPKVFPPIMTSLLKASEVSGTMGPMLERISSYLGKEHQTVKKIKGAMTYPAVMLVMILVVTVGLLVWVLPRFAGIFESKGAALPLPTVMLMTISDTLIGGWVYWLAGVVVAVAGFVVFNRSAAGRSTMDRVKLSSPILGTLFRKLYVTRATRTMGVMLHAGVPILDMVAIVRAVTNNVHFQQLWDDADERLRQGAQLSDVLFDSPLIPKPVAQMIYAGERAGRMGQTMMKIADYTEEEFDEQVKTTTNYIEPLMVAVMGGIVGFVAIALLLPIFSVSSVVSG